MRDIRDILNIGFDGFAILCWAFVAYVVLRRFGFHQASPILAGTFAIVALAALVGDLLRDRRHGKLMSGHCPRCEGRNVSNFHRCRSYLTAETRWEAPVTEWQCRECSYSVSENLACAACPEKPGFWPR
jgi:hypothetical protein